VIFNDIRYLKKEVLDRALTARAASQLLSLSYRHTVRLKDKVKIEGLQGLLRKTPVSPPNKKNTDEVVNEILRLRRQLYCDFNMAHFKDKLKENNHIDVSYESLRQILITHKGHRLLKRKVIHRKGRRMPQGRDGASDGFLTTPMA